MENKSAEISWVDRVHKRYKETGTFIPVRQRKLYESISKHFCSGRVCMDIGCSTGLGTNILSHTARFAWGLDINEEAIDYAKKIFKRPNIDFELFDVEKPPNRPLSKFEIVVMSEIIEHLTDPEAALNNVKRFFNPKGHTIGFITCPNQNNRHVRKNEAKHGFHTQKWTAGEFYALLTKHFEVVTMFDVDKVDKWDMQETIDGNSDAYMVCAKVERIK